MRWVPRRISITLENIVFCVIGPFKTMKVVQLEFFSSITIIVGGRGHVSGENMAVFFVGARYPA